MTGFASRRPSAPRRHRTAPLLLALVVLVGSLTACATRQPPAEPRGGSSGEFPAEVTVPGMPPVTVPAEPHRIVSLSPTATESLYAIGAGEQVLAVGKHSDFPAGAPRTELSGLGTNADAVAAHNPDLVILHDSAAELAEGLRTIGVPVLVTPAAKSLDQAYRQIEALGLATGHADEAARLTHRMRTEIERLVAATPKPAEPLSYYHELSPDHYTSTSGTFIGGVYGLFGLRNIADSAATQFPQLSAEHILTANPDLIFLADTECCGQTAESVAARPGWGTLGAVRQGQVVELDDDIAGRWGPRLVELVRAVSDAVTRAQQS